MTFLSNTPLPIYLLLIVFVGIAIRKIGKIILPIWLLMLSAAAVSLFSGAISLHDAFYAIKWNVMFYLFGVFVIGQALESSNYLEHVSLQLFNKAKNLSTLLWMMIVVFAFGSALLMNDTLAIIGTPVVLLLAKHHRFPAKPFLLSLAFAITIGSVMSPVGNPQNLLIANSGLANPFVTFFMHLAIPTVINLAVLYAFIRVYFRDVFNIHIEAGHSDKQVDQRLALLSKLSILILIIMILANALLTLWHIDMPFAAVALVSCAPILLLSKRRGAILKHLDWYTLLFFLGLFVFMQSVWQTNYFQHLLAASHIVVNHKGVIFSISVIMSQFISNVPLVALYLPLLHHATTNQLMALAAGSTIAGNLLILGAASNVIVLQNAEKRGDAGFSFLDFVKIGLPLTLVNVLVYYLFL